MVAWTKQPPAGTGIDRAAVVPKPTHVLLGTIDRCDGSLRGVPENSPEKKYSKFGEYYKFNDTQSQNINWGDATKFINPSVFTFATRVFVPSGAGGFFGFSSRTGTTTDGVDSLWSGGTNVSIRVAKDTYRQDGAAVDCAGYEGQWLTQVSWFDESLSQPNGIHTSVYAENGNLIGRATGNESGSVGTVTAITDHSEDLLVGMRSTSDYNAQVELVMFWDTRLSYVEMDAFAKNPYQIFKPKPRFALTDMPADVRLLTAPKPWTKQPPAGVGVDWSNPLAKGLVFFGPSNADLQDAVSGKRGVAHNPSSSNPHLDQRFTARAHESNATTDGGIYWPDLPSLNSLSGQPNATILCIAEIDSWSSYGGLFGIPDEDTGWASPYYNLELCRYITNTYPRLHYGFGSSRRVASGFYEVNGTRHLYGAVKTAATTVDFYKDGEFWGASTVFDVADSDANLAISGSTTVNAFSRNITAGGEGANGRFIVGAIWNRALSAEEIRAWYSNPYQLLKPQSIYATYPYVPPELGGPDGRDRLFTFKRPWK